MNAPCECIPSAINDDWIATSERHPKHVCYETRQEIMLDVTVELYQSAQNSLETAYSSNLFWHVHPSTLLMTVSTISKRWRLNRSILSRKLLLH